MVQEMELQNDTPLPLLWCCSRVASSLHPTLSVFARTVTISPLHRCGKRGGAVRAARRLERDARKAERAVSGGRGGGRFWLFQRAEPLHHHKHGEGDEKKVDDMIDELPVSDHRGSRLLRGRKTVVMLSGKADEETGKIYFAKQQPDRRHDDVVHQRGDDLAKSCSQNESHGQVEH